MRMHSLLRYGNADAIIQWNASNMCAQASDELSRAADIIAQATQALLEAKEKADKELAERKKKNPSDALYGEQIVSAVMF